MMTTKEDIFAKLISNKNFLGDFISNPEATLIKYNVSIENRDKHLELLDLSDNLSEYVKSALSAHVKDMDNSCNNNDCGNR